MSCLSISELPATERSNIIDMRTRKHWEAQPESPFGEMLRERDEIRLQVTSHCRMLNLSAQQTADAIGHAQAAKRSGKSVEAAVAVGQAKANHIAQTQRDLRTRYGTRPDGPEAA